MFFVFTYDQCGDGVSDGMSVSGRLVSRAPGSTVHSRHTAPEGDSTFRFIECVCGCIEPSTQEHGEVGEDQFIFFDGSVGGGFLFIFGSHLECRRPWNQVGCECKTLHEIAQSTADYH